MCYSLFRNLAMRSHLGEGPSCAHQTLPNSTTNVAATALSVVHIPYQVCLWELTLCSRMRGVRRFSTLTLESDVRASLKITHRLILTMVCYKHMEKDRLEQITSKDSVAYLPTVLLQRHSLERVWGKACIQYFTLEGGSCVWRGIYKPWKDRRLHGLKVMSNEPLRGKEADSVIHSDRAS